MIGIAKHTFVLNSSAITDITRKSCKQQADCEWHGLNGGVRRFCIAKNREEE